MADRIALALAGAILLAGCSGGVPGEPEIDESSLIDCAIGEATRFSRNCAVERVVEDGTLFLTIRHENGGFRRLQVMTDGSGVIAADGAEEAAVTVFDGEIEVALGGDRYLLPATIVGDDSQ